MKIKNQVLGEQAYVLVKEMILSRKLRPGQKIIQDKLAEDLGVSRTPLRTALQILEGENLVESIPRRGVYVKAFSLQEINDLYDCRIALEAMAVKRFTQRNELGVIKELEQLFSSFEIGTIHEKKYQKADSKFHAAIANHCGNEFLRKTIHHSNMLLCIDIIGLVRPPEETLSEHIKIIEAIKTKDVALAERLMICHLEKSKELIQKKIEHETQGILS